MSLSLLDSMAFGACIITSDIPANADAIDDAGLTFEVRNADALRDQLANIIDNPELAEDLRKRAADRAANDFDWDKIAAQFEELYASL